MPNELARSLAGQSLAPVAAQEPVSELGLSVNRALVRALGRLKDPPADELAINESDPEAESDHTPCGREAMLVAPFDVLAAARPAIAQVAHHFGVGVEFDLILEVFVRQRDQPKTAGAKRRLAHGCIVPPRPDARF